MPRPRVVMLSPVLPYDFVPHAGGGYVKHLVELLGSEAELTLVVPNTPSNRAAASQVGAVTALMVGGEHRDTISGKTGAAVIARVDARRRLLDPGASSLVFAAGLRRPGPARDALERADLVDLQWSEMIRLAEPVRRINPRARFVGTFHDVQSQLFSRETARNPVDPFYWRAVAALSRRAERLAIDRLDTTLVFSVKDAELLGSPPSSRVLLPPLAAGDEQPRPRVAADPNVLFVAHFARFENDQAARWLLREIWPTVIARVPNARLRLVGAGVQDDLASLVAARDDVEMSGFVPELDTEYERARCCVIPLQQGAGVKFKTVEALVHDVPTVTTPIGAEGVEGNDLFAGVSRDPAAFASAVVDVLERPEAYSARSARAQAWATHAYGARTFVAAVREVYVAPDLE